MTNRALTVSVMDQTLIIIMELIVFKSELPSAIGRAVEVRKLTVVYQFARALLMVFVFQALPLEIATTFRKALMERKRCGIE